MLTWTFNGQKASMEEQKKEDFRKKMVLHLEKYLKEICLEIMFPYLDIDFIQELKSQPEIKDFNSVSRADIRVLVCYCKLQTLER